MTFAHAIRLQEDVLASDFDKLPLVVDLDGTLTATDTLVESVFIILKTRPLSIFALLYILLFGGGRAKFKESVSHLAALQPGNLPWRHDVLAIHLDMFDRILATRSSFNLKGRNKLNAIREQIGSDFVYAGDSRADLAIWRECSAAVVVGASPGISKAAHRVTRVVKEFHYRRPSLRTWLTAMRMHQWVKNLLLFVPLGTAFTFNDGTKILAMVLGFFAFSLVASATYLLNDLWDLNNDRRHPRKRFRPFASGDLSLLSGVAVAGTLLAFGFGLAFMTAPVFALVVAGYVVLTTAYSWALKEYVLVDVVMLAMLYTYLVLAGAIATDIAVTPWLLAFSIFIFFSLALVKRCAELVSLKQTEQHGAHGRDYQVGDLVVLWPLGVGASLCSVVIFGLYIGTPGVIARYGNPDILWLVGVALLYWNARLWIKTARGEMHDDPIVFAFRDTGSRITVIGMLILTAAAYFFG